MNIILWVVQVLVAVAFLGAGVPKLAGAEAMVKTFEQLGLGQWFRYVTGSLEIIGALLIITPRWSAFGAALLACVMAGAILSLLIKIPGSPLPAIALLVLSLFVLWGRRDQIKALFS